MIEIVGNIIGLGAGASIALESGVKTIEGQLQGTNSELLYLIDRYSYVAKYQRPYVHLYCCAQSFAGSNSSLHFNPLFLILQKSNITGKDGCQDCRQQHIE